MSPDGGGDTPNAPILLTEGPFAGWKTWSYGQDHFETLNGPFCFKIEGDKARCAFQPRPDHCNAGGFLHGGALMSFADFALFSIAHKALPEGVHAVTLSFNCEFLRTGTLDGWIEAEGDLLRETRSVIFVRGLVTQVRRPVLAFSATLKKITR